MKKKFFLITLLFFGCLNVTTAQDISKIDAALLNEMSLHANSEQIKINIILTAQYDQMELRNKANSFKNKEAKRYFVVNELKRFSNETQSELKAVLNDYSTISAVSGINSFWIANFINCYATISAIEELSYHPDILIIGWDREEKLIPDNEKSIPADPTREITYNVLKVSANQVWDLGYTGEGVVVAVLDTGVNYNHNDLAGNMWTHPNYPYHGYNFVHINNNPIDDHGHGTHCAGTIAGHGVSGSQTGMAPQAKIMALKVLDSEGYGSVSGVVSAIQFSIDNGAHILSMSIGWAMPDMATRIQFRNAMVNTLEAGVIASVAAGNEGDELWYFPIPQNVRTPGDCPPPWLHPDQTITGGLSATVCVGATDSNDNPAYFTSNGPVTWQSVTGFNDYAYNPGIGLIRPDVSAPGVYIY